MILEFNPVIRRYEARRLGKETKCGVSFGQEKVKLAENAQEKVV